MVWRWTWGVLALGCGADVPSPSPSPHNPFEIRLTIVEDALSAAYAPAHRGGVVIADLDGDGDLDVVLARGASSSNRTPGGPSVLLRHEGTRGGMPHLVAEPGFSQLVAGVSATGAAAGDYDRDGDLDLFLSARGGDVLLRNEGDATFVDVTAQAGVAGPDADVTDGALWVDLDADGLLDLYVLQHVAMLPPPTQPEAVSGNRLYRNLGDGTFEDVGVAQGVDDRGAAHAALAADLDGDGELEIYVANDQYVSSVGVLLRPPEAYLPPDAFLDPVEDGWTRRFVNRTAEIGTDGPRDAMAIALADLDRDADPDLYVADWGDNHLQLWDQAQGRYASVAAQWDLARGEASTGEARVSWNVRFLDLDRDGLEELLMVNGWQRGAVLECLDLSQLDLLLRRPSLQQTFVDISAAAGLVDPDDADCEGEPLEPSIAGRGLALGDLDGDGDDDLILAAAGEPFRWIRNDTAANEHDWLRVRPLGTVSSPSPVGAVLEVRLDDGSRQREFLYAGGDVGSQGDGVLEIGLGTRAVGEAWMHWPSGVSTRLDTAPDFSLGRELVVTEPPWLRVEPRVVAPGQAPAQLTIERVQGLADGTWTVQRSDGAPIELVDDGQTITASIEPPVTPGAVTLRVTVDGRRLRPRPTVWYR